jgi:chromosomal replication initiator protein
METFWKQVKAVVKGQLPDHSFRMWIEPIQCHSFEDGNVVLSCPNYFSRKRVQENYGDLIQAALLRVMGKECIVAYEVSRGNNGGAPPSKDPALQLRLPHDSLRPCNGRLLRKDFTFDQFVVGGNNDFAYSASLSLASRNDGSQSSLLLLSGTGMGKSHLTQAIGHHILSHFPRERVFYMTAEDFSNEMVQAYRYDTIDKFKGKYRTGCDVLLLEDVHHLSGKERTQVELALTLDSLFEANKKIIFSSCYRPAEIPKIDDYLRSRLSCGLISNIDPPNFRTRVRILQRKARQKGFQIPENVLQYLASELTEDIRQLESGLIGVTAKASLLGCCIDLPLAESVVKNIVRQRKSITIEGIKKMVCKHFEISVNEIVSRSRKQSLVRPRQIAMYLARNYTDSPLQEIGRSFNRYHATALHAINAVEQGVRTNQILQKQVEFFRQKIQSGNF